MRINKFVALATGLSRRKADELIDRGEVTVNGLAPQQGQAVTTTDVVRLGTRVIEAPVITTTILFNKPVGYVVSREGQGSQTIYDILPPEYSKLKPIGRLDKYSSGILLLTNDGNLANELTHPSRQKAKIYEVTIDRPLEPLHRQMISDHGIQLDDGPSKLQLERLKEGNDTAWRVTMHEGRNRQIRRTFNALGYRVKTLHRTHFGPYDLQNLGTGHYRLHDTE
jgi:23S rRNA pseudouridine2605 synthase